MEVKTESESYHNIKTISISASQITLKKAKILVCDARKEFPNLIKEKDEKEFCDLAKFESNNSENERKTVKKDPERNFYFLTVKEPEIPKPKVKMEVTKNFITSKGTTTTFSEFRCQICHKNFSSKENFTLHTKLHFQTHLKNNQKFSCDQCNLILKNLAAIRRHVLTHAVHKINCKICHAKIKPSGLSYHTLAFHNHNEVKCQICYKVFGNSYLLKQHQKTHKIRHLECKFCCKKFHFQGLFNSHMKFHENPDQFKCKICSFQTNTKRNLISHLKIHNDNREKHLKCDRCDYKTDNKSNFKMHINKLHKKIVKLKTLPNVIKCPSVLKDNCNKLDNEVHMETDINDVIFNISSEGETIESARATNDSQTRSFQQNAINNCHSGQKIRKSVETGIEERTTERKYLKRKISGIETPKDIFKSSNNAQTLSTAMGASPSLLTVIETQSTDFEPPRSFDEIKIAVIPKNYPTSVLTEQEYDSFNSYVGIRMDSLPEDSPLPNFVFTNFVQGYGAYNCTDESSADFLKKIASEFYITQDLIAIPQSDLPKSVIFSTFTRDKDFSENIFLKRIPRQNLGLGLDTSEWKIFNARKEKDGTYFNIEMDAPSALRIISNGGWLFYWLSTIKLVNVNETN